MCVGVSDPLPQSLKAGIILAFLTIMNWATIWDTHNISCMIIVTLRGNGGFFEDHHYPYCSDGILRAGMLGASH